MLHLTEIKRAFGISGLQVTAHAWRGEHTQIDLLLNRSDKTLDICEIKYSDTPYALDKTEHDKLLARKHELQDSLALRRRIRTVLITSSELKANKYSSAIQSALTLKDLFL